MTYLAKFTFVLIATMISSISLGQVDKSYHAVMDSAGQSSSGLKFSIAYTTGVHKGSASHMEGLAIIDQNDQLKQLDIRVPITTMSTGNPTRDCHMREALGLDYTQSRFPKDHVCNSADQTPAQGSDAIAFHDINFKFLQIEQTAVSATMNPNVEYPLLITARISIHGVTKDIHSIEIKVTKTIDKDETVSYHVKSSFSLSLNDFGVIVKPLKLGPFSIGVDDKVNLDIAVALRP